MCQSLRWFTMLPSVTAARHPLEVFGPGSNPGGAATKRIKEVR